VVGVLATEADGEMRDPGMKYLCEAEGS
jgi:hypothetical protein